LPKRSGNLPLNQSFPEIQFDPGMALKPSTRKKPLCRPKLTAAAGNVSMKFTEYTPFSCLVLPIFVAPSKGELFAEH
jgi:hypothetical protein